MTNIAPLGIFGRIASQSAFSENSDELRQRIGAIPVGERAKISEYLRRVILQPTAVIVQ